MLCVYISVKDILKISFCDLAQNTVRKTFSVVSYMGCTRDLKMTSSKPRTAVLEGLRLLWCAWDQKTEKVTSMLRTYRGKLKRKKARHDEQQWLILMSSWTLLQRDSPLSLCGYFVSWPLAVARRAKVLEKTCLSKCVWTEGWVGFGIMIWANT